MKKIWKYIVGFFTFVGGILTLFLLGSNKNKRVKELKGKIKDNKSAVKDFDAQIKAVEKNNEALRKTLESKKQALKEIEVHKYKKKNIGKKEASDFLKKYSKGKK